MREVGRHLQTATALSHVLTKTPPPCTCSAPSPRRLAGVHLSLSFVSERTALLHCLIGGVVSGMTSAYNLDFMPLTESRLMASSDSM